MLCYCYGSVSDHFGPSAFNKFGFGFGKQTVKSTQQPNNTPSTYLLVGII